jgi:ATP-dependent RNA helicase DDX1
MLPKGGAGMDRLQVCFFSATLHSKEITTLADQICHNPTWVDLKGDDIVPDTVHHVFISVDPSAAATVSAATGGAAAAAAAAATAAATAAGGSKAWAAAVPANVVTDGVHTKDPSVKAGADELALSEGVKRLKPLLLKRIVDEFNMTQCIIFCRTNLDCDNLEKYLIAEGGGTKFRPGADTDLNK